MEFIRLKDVRVGDILEGPDGPGLVKSFDRHEGQINFQNDRCMMVTQGEKIVRHVSADILIAAGLKPY